MEMALTKLMVALHNNSLPPPERILSHYFVFVYKPEKERESLTTYNLSCFVGWVVGVFLNVYY